MVFHADYASLKICMCSATSRIWQIKHRKYFISHSKRKTNKSRLEAGEVRQLLL